MSFDLTGLPSGTPRQTRVEPAGSKVSTGKEDSKQPPEPKASTSVPMPNPGGADPAASQRKAKLGKPDAKTPAGKDAQPSKSLEKTSAKEGAGAAQTGQSKPDTLPTLNPLKKDASEADVWKTFEERNQAMAANPNDKSDNPAYQFPWPRYFLSDSNEAIQKMRDAGTKMDKAFDAELEKSEDPNLSEAEREKAKANKEALKGKKEFRMALAAGAPDHQKSIEEGRKIREGLDKPGGRLDPKKPQDGWADNTKVFASSSSEQTTVADKMNLAVAFSNLKDAPSLTEAFEQVEKKQQGIVTGKHIQTPVSSDKPMEAWNKSESLPRKALIIMGNPGTTYGNYQYTVDESNKRLKDLTVSQLSQHYGLKDDDIKILDNPTREELKQAMGEMKTFSEQNKGAEAAVFAFGHAKPTGKLEPGIDKADAKKEGAGVGQFLLWQEPQKTEEEQKANPNPKRDWITETDMKKLFRENLGGYKSVVFALEACHSGEWIAGTNGRSNPWSAV